jgi:deferrochelatase/peroxidase EfeB
MNAPTMSAPTTPARCLVDIPFADVQGGILTGYGRQGFPFARYGLVNVQDAAAGRAFVEALRNQVTTAVRWPSRRKALAAGRVEIERPLVTLNLAFTFYGLHALGVSTRTLKGFPDEFVDGMAARCDILGDDTPENPRSNWDPVWLQQDSRKAGHILVMLNAQDDGTGRPVAELDATCARIEAMCAPGKLTLLSGHRGENPRWQQLETVRDKAGLPCAKEHFGYTDGISDPVFDGQYAAGQGVERSVGFGATDGAGNWRPLAPGEFLLGWPDEAQEVPGSALPLDFSRNGTFFAYRKLHQDIVAFTAWVDATAAQLQRVWALGSFEEAKETLLAKMAGRWSDGVPLSAAPTYADWQEFNRLYPPSEAHTVRDDSERQRRLVDFLYHDDVDGTRCPMTAHVRRANTRDMLDPRATGAAKDRMGSALNNRRRIIRRGLPYGKDGAADGEHGVVMLVVCASLQRQFEFVQQQWMNYGLDSNAGNDTCPLIGNHGPDEKFVIAADPTSGRPPFFATGLRQWVQTRGGDYFFQPSMTALRMIGMGVTDPT